jgi:acetyl esterase/lipase
MVVGPLLSKILAARLINWTGSVKLSQDIYSMKTLWSAVVLIVIALLFFFTHKKPPSPSRDAFWANHFKIETEIPYNTESVRQRLDLYSQGKWSGEPNYFNINESPRPALIQIHGGGWISGDKADVANWLMPYVAKGWNVVNLNYRIGDHSAPEAIDDVMCAIKWVAERAKTYNFDTSKIVITGFSSGGHLALIAALMNRELRLHRCYAGDQLTIRAVINWFGISDIERLENFLANNNQPNYPLRWIGQKSKVHLLSKKYSPIHYVNARSPAILTIHGNRDTVVPYDQATYFHQALDKNGVKNQLLTLTGGTHGGFSDAQYQEAFTKIFSFLREIGID